MLTPVFGIAILVLVAIVSMGSRSTNQLSFFDANAAFVVVGRVIGALLIGIVESMTSTFYGPSWAPAVAFGFLLLTLAVRPAGLLGR